MSRECPFEILGVHPHDATQQEVDKAYRHKALEVHPDKNPDDPLAKARMQKLNDAKERADTIIIRRQREAKAEHKRMAEFQRKAEEAKRREDEQAASRQATEDLRKATETLRKENAAKLKAMEAQRQADAMAAERQRNAEEAQRRADERLAEVRRQSNERLAEIQRKREEAKCHADARAAERQQKAAEERRQAEFDHPKAVEARRLQKIKEERDAATVKAKWACYARLGGYDVDSEEFASIRKQVEEEFGDYDNDILLTENFRHNEKVQEVIKHRKKEKRQSDAEALKLETKAAQALEAQRLLETKAAQALEREAQRQRDIKTTEELERATKAAEELEAQKQRNIKAAEELKCKEREDLERATKAAEELEAQKQRNIKATEELECKQREDLERATKAAQELEAQKQRNIKAAEELERTAKAVEELEAQRQHNIKAAEELERKAQRQHNIKAAEEREAQAMPELDDQQECEINEADDTFKEAEGQKPTKKRKHVSTWNQDPFYADGLKQIDIFIETRIQIASDLKNVHNVNFFVPCVDILDAFFKTQTEVARDNSKVMLFYKNFSKQMVAKHGPQGSMWHSTMRQKIRGYKGLILLPF